MNLTQRAILDVIKDWAKVEKKPITFKDIAERLPDHNPRTLRISADTLCRKGLVRRGVKVDNHVTYIKISNF